MTLLIRHWRQWLSPAARQGRRLHASTPLAFPSNKDTVKRSDEQRDSLIRRQEAPVSVVRWLREPSRADFEQMLELPAQSTGAPDRSEPVRIAGQHGLEVDRQSIRRLTEMYGLRRGPSPEERSKSRDA